MVTNTEAASPRTFKPKDFASNQEVRWCPGCGDYAILAGVQRALAKQGVPPERVAFISGIGCSSRFPYYMETYGFHTIHGRAPAVATGLKIARPDMQVWVMTGDGDALSIGGNHFVHVLRRNVDLRIVLFNNRIYGLTKGQYSPTSEIGKKTKSSPQGSLDHPFNPISVAVGAEASFIARTIDVDALVMQEVLAAATAHRGAALIEVLQNCNIFNDGAWADISGKDVRPDRTIHLVDGQPMVFGAQRDRGIRLVGLRPEVVKFGGGRLGEADLWVHDASDPDPTRAFLLSRMIGPDFPVPVGVLRRIERPAYDALVNEQVANQQQAQKADLQALLDGKRPWVVA
mgnify:CR=1 FL=1